MRPFSSALVLVAFVVSGCATAPENPRLLAGPDALLAATLGEVCIPHVIDGVDMAITAEKAGYSKVTPRQAGSDLATEAWRLGAVNFTYVMRLPNNACSISIEKADGAALMRQAVERVGTRVALERVDADFVRDGKGNRVVYCSNDTRPLVMSVIVAENEPNFVLNIFRSAAANRSLCRPRMPGS